MRICYIADAGSIHTKRWVQYFSDGGHDVYLISPRPFGDSNIGTVDLYVLNHPCSRIRIISFLINLLHDIIAVRRLVRRIRPDILHAHFATVCGFLAALTGFHPLVVSAWGSDVLVAPRISKISKLMTRLALRKADLTMTTSQYLKEYLHRELKLPEHSLVALPWGIDMKIFHKGYKAEVEELRANLGIEDNDFVVLSPRHLWDHYRIEYIVQALPYIAAEYPNVVLVLLKGAARDGEYESKIDNLAKELGVAKYTRFIRRELRPLEMALLYNAVDALISIPKSDQFSSCIMEGMACGTIPIIGNLEVYRQYLTDEKNALFVNSENPKHIPQRVIYCIRHRELKDKFYRINKKIIEQKEDWNKNAPKMEALYRVIIQKWKEPGS